MIIVEGCDGSGKTTLLRALREFYPSVSMHARASDSTNGPVPNLYEWAREDVFSWPEQPLSFYDRHPLISEYIYGPIVRGSMDERFQWTSTRRYLARHALVIVCTPPLDAVRRAVSAERDMPGVTTHIDAIWSSYAALPALWPVSYGLVTYDYTDPSRSIADHLVPHINQHISEWKRNNG